MVPGGEIGAVRVSVNAPATQPANFASQGEVIRHMTTTTRIVAAAIALLSLLPLATAQASTPPPIAPLKPIEVKWILPPDYPGWGAYEGNVLAATLGGYDTVEHDDLSYPGRRP